MMIDGAMGTMVQKNRFEEEDCEYIFSRAHTRVLRRRPH